MVVLELVAPLPVLAPKVEVFVSNQTRAMATRAGSEVPPFALACLDGTAGLGQEVCSSCHHGCRLLLGVRIGPKTSKRRALL